MKAITYHANACALAGVPPRLSTERLAQLVARQRELKVRLPETVVEWYAISGAVEFQAKHTDDGVRSLDALGLPYVDDDYTAAGVLLIAMENQGCYSLVVPLDGRADPPVQLMDAEGADDLAAAVAAREHFADSFSDFVRACVWDARVYRASFRRALRDVAFGPDQVARLRTRFREEPATGLADGEMTYRLERDGLRLMATVFHGRATRLQLAADTAEGLEELLAMVPADRSVTAEDPAR